MDDVMLNRLLKEEEGLVRWTRVQECVRHSRRCCVPRPEAAWWPLSSCKAHGKWRGVRHGTGDRKQAWIMRIPPHPKGKKCDSADQGEPLGTDAATHCGPCLREIFFLQLSSGGLGEAQVVEGKTHLCISHILPGKLPLQSFPLLVSST